MDEDADMAPRQRADWYVQLEEDFARAARASRARAALRGESVEIHPTNLCLECCKCLCHQTQHVTRTHRSRLFKFLHSRKQRAGQAQFVDEGKRFRKHGSPSVVDASRVSTADGSPSGVDPAVARKK